MTENTSTNQSNDDSTVVEDKVQNVSVSPVGGKKNRDSAGLSYMPLICIFIYMSKKDDPFVLENAKQGVALFVIMIIGWIFSLLLPIIGLPIVIVSVVFMVMGFMKAFSSGETISIPFLSNYLKKHDFKDMIDSTMNSIQDGVDKVSKQASDVQNKVQNTAKNVSNTVQSEPKKSKPVSQDNNDSAS